VQTDDPSAAGAGHNTDGLASSTDGPSTARQREGGERGEVGAVGHRLYGHEFAFYREGEGEAPRRESSAAASSNAINGVAAVFLGVNGERRGKGKPATVTCMGGRGGERRRGAAAGRRRVGASAPA
jgi:hypothetical protein